MDKLDIIKNDMNGLKYKIEVFTEVTMRQIVRDTLGTSSNNHPSLPPQTTDQDPPQDPQTNSNTDDVNCDQEMNDVSHHTIDDDVHDVSEDLN